MGNCYSAPKYKHKRPQQQTFHNKSTQNQTCHKCQNTFMHLTNQQFQQHIHKCHKIQQIPKPSPILIHDIQPLTLPNFNIPVMEQIYEKIAVNQQKTLFKWQKRFFNVKNINEFQDLTKQQIAKRPFQQKIIWFRDKLEKFRIPWENGCDWLKIQKQNVLMTSLESVLKVNMYKQVKIEFFNQNVNDAGGLLRQWMHLAIKQIFSEQTGIFEFANTSQIMYKIRWDKELDQYYAMKLFQLFGTILGKAIFERIPLNTFLDHTIIRQLTSNKIQLRDINGYDKELYKNWKYLLDNEIEPFSQFFVLYKQHTDQSIQQIPLIQNGAQIQLTQQNKLKYIQLSIEEYCKKSVSIYIKSIKKSFHKIIPQELISIFDTYQIQMILYGVPFINLQQWISNTQYKGAYYKNHQTIKWFWNVVKTFDQQQLSRLLHFCTGSRRTPIYGFKKLESNRGNYSKFLIQSVEYNANNPYPKGHTCFNRLELPMYKNAEDLRLYVRAVVSKELDGVYGLD